MVPWISESDGEQKQFVTAISVSNWRKAKLTTLKTNLMNLHRVMSLLSRQKKPASQTVGFQNTPQTWVKTEQIQISQASSRPLRAHLL